MLNDNSYRPLLEETTGNQNGSEIELGNTNHEDEAPTKSRRKVLLIAAFSMFFVKAICTASVFSYNIGYRNSLSDISKQDNAQDVATNVYTSNYSALEGNADTDKLMCWGEGEDCTEPEVGIFMECCEGLTCVQDYGGGEDGSISIKPVCMPEKSDEEHEKNDEGPDDEGLMCWGEGEDCTEPEVGIFQECCEGLICVQDYSGGEDGSISIKPVCMPEKPDEAPEGDDEKPDDGLMCYAEGEDCTMPGVGISKKCCEGLICVWDYTYGENGSIGVHLVCKAEIPDEEPEEDDEKPDDGLMCWAEGEDCTEPEVGIFQKCCEGLICVQDYSGGEDGSISIKPVCMPEKPDEEPEEDDEKPDDGLMCYAEGESCNRNEPGIYRDCCDGLECQYDWFTWESTCKLKGEVKPNEPMCIPKGSSCGQAGPGIYMDCCKGSTCTYKYVPNWWGGVSVQALCA